MVADLNSEVRERRSSRIVGRVSRRGLCAALLSAPAHIAGRAGPPAPLSSPTKQQCRRARCVRRDTTLVTIWVLSRELMVMADGDPRSDAELLAATPGDPDAFAVFYQRHVRTLAAFVERRAQQQDVGDLVAEVFATALVHRRRYDPARGNGYDWLAGIARHKLADAARRGTAEARLCRRLGMCLPKSYGSAPEVDASAQLLDALPADQRLAVQQRVLADKAYAQIAREQSVSEQAVRKRVSRALTALRSRIQEDRQ
jgi:DNA-directed RNA polymerase specialized sigma24 family protein